MSPHLIWNPVKHCWRVTSRGNLWRHGWSRKTHYIIKISCLAMQVLWEENTAFLDSNLRGKQTKRNNKQYSAMCPNHEPSPQRRPFEWENKCPPKKFLMLKRKLYTAIELDYTESKWHCLSYCVLSSCYINAKSRLQGQVKAETKGNKRIKSQFVL